MSGVKPRAFFFVGVPVCFTVVFAGVVSIASSDARADSGLDAVPDVGTTSTCGATRPVVMFNRWQEDWSVLSNPCVLRRPLDGLKYIPLGEAVDSFLSLGANLRERLEFNNAPLFGLGSARSDTYVIQRAEVRADARIQQHIQFFVQLEDARAFDKNAISPVDKNPLDLEQGFVAWTSSLGAGTLKFRVGRQEMAFDLQRFIAVRDGTNVRQTFDAIWADYEFRKWRFIAYATQPVQNRTISAFDDVSGRRLTFSGVRFERQDVGPGEVTGYYSRYNRSNASFFDVTGDERRDVFDLRYGGKTGPMDWDVESMYQAGRVGSDTIGAWAVGSLAGYTFATAWAPRGGLQVDAASGDRHPSDGRVGRSTHCFQMDITLRLPVHGVRKSSAH
jgi:Alginate export